MGSIIVIILKHELYNHVEEKHWQIHVIVDTRRGVDTVDTVDMVDICYSRHQTRGRYSKHGRYGRYMLQQTVDVGVDTVDTVDMLDIQVIVDSRLRGRYSRQGIDMVDTVDTVETVDFELSQRIFKK